MYPAFLRQTNRWKQNRIQLLIIYFLYLSIVHNELERKYKKSGSSLLENGVKRTEIQICYLHLCLVYTQQQLCKATEIEQRLNGFFFFFLEILEVIICETQTLKIQNTLISHTVVGSNRLVTNMVITESCHVRTKQRCVEDHSCTLCKR